MVVVLTNGIPEVHRLWRCFPPLDEFSREDCCGLDVVSLKESREPSLRHLLAIAIRCRIIVDLGPICVVSGKGYACKTATWVVSSPLPR